MEHTMMLTNKGRCRAGGAEAMRDGTRSCLVNRSSLRDTHTETTRDGRWQRVTRDRCYMRHEMRVTKNVAVLQSLINNSDKWSFLDSFFKENFQTFARCTFSSVRISAFLCFIPSEIENIWAVCPTTQVIWRRAAITNFHYRLICQIYFCFIYRMSENTKNITISMSPGFIQFTITWRKEKKIFGIFA